MKNFFKIVFASMVGLLLFSIIWLIFVVAAIGGAVSSMGGEQEGTPLTKPSILEIKIDNAVPDRVSFDPMSLLEMGSKGKSIGLNTLLKSIDRAKTDKNIKGIVFYPGLSAGISSAQVEEIREGLKDFKKTGKFVYSYADMYDQNTYWLASVSDTVCLQTEGSIMLRGVHLEVMFYKGLLDKLGVEIQVIRHGKFKSAVEPYIQTAMSAANKEQYTVLAKSIWSSIEKDVAQGRNMSRDKVNEAASNVYGAFASEAKEAGLVDMVSPYNQFTAMLMHKMGVKKEKELETVSIGDYSKIAADMIKTTNKIAVVYATGEIGVGKGDDGEIGMENVIEALKEAASDDDVKAIVLRVNSPGGSVLTSDMIYWEVLEAQKKKPVIASFGSYAASGGYYISCSANRIFANPTTLTGSIGVFGMIPNIKKVTDKLGVSFDEVNTHPNAAYLSIRRPMSANEQERQQRSIEKVYAGFIGKVAKGRKMSVAAVDSIGQGRVWSGTNGLEIGLVDELGGLKEAIAYAAKSVKLKEYKTVAYPKQKSTYETVMESFSNIRVNSAIGIVEDFAGSDAADLLRAAKQVKESGKSVVMARMPYGVIVE